jgi:hypothetical protein
VNKDRWLHIEFAVLLALASLWLANGFACAWRALDALF